MNCHRSTTPDPLVGAVAGGVTLLVLAVAFSLHALDVGWAWVVYPLGFGGLLPLALGIAGRYGRNRAVPSDSRGEALATLRERYVRGELDETGFEERVERLLETETVADARERYGDR
jgi:hypothetical protein